MTVRRAYRTPPIIEALCEFRLAPGQSWDWTLPGLVFGEMKGDFPLKAQQNVMELSMEARGDVVAPMVKGGVARMQFLSQDKARQIGIGPDLLSAHVMRPYPGWEVFRPIIERAFGVYRGIALPAGVNRIGVRYINRVEIPSACIELADYFVSPPRIPAPLPQEMRDFVSRVVVVYDEQTTLVQTLASAASEGPEVSSILLDLDTVFHATGDPLPLDRALEKVERLRQFEREAFEALITDRARSLFDV